MIKRGWGLFAIALIGVASVAAAKSPPAKSPLVSALEACRSITDAGQRLACFDRTSGALVDAARKGDVQVVDRAQMREARRSLFGFSMPKLPFFSGDRSVEDDQDELATTITSVRAIGHGRFRIAIAQGNAVWETLESPMSLSDPKRGQKIVIKRGTLGSYILRIDGQRGVKGKRVS